MVNHIAVLCYVLFYRLEKAANVQNQVSSGTRSRVLAAVGGSKAGDQKSGDVKSSEEIKEKLEQQLKLQRVAHQQKRVADKSGPNTPTTSTGTQQVIKIIPTTSHGNIPVFILLSFLEFICN